MGFLGPCGTHSEEVALYLIHQGNAKEWELEPYGDIKDAICSVAQGGIDSCVVPIENSLEGSINITLDTLAHDVDLVIEREIVWRVHNQLMAKYPNAPIKTIISHPQPLAQCRGYIRENYAEAEIKQVSSTARAAEIVAASKGGCAAIGTFRAGELYNLKPLATEIQDSEGNCTRFLVLRRPGEGGEGGKDKTELICQIDGARSGSLYNVLWEFAKRDVNLTHIESRPAKTNLGEYIFFFSIEGGCGEASVKESIQAVEKKSLWLKNLGSFNTNQVDIKKLRKGGKKVW